MTVRVFGLYKDFGALSLSRKQEKNEMISIKIIPPPRFERLLRVLHPGHSFP